MTKAEIKALRRPFLKELFRKNKFNFAMTLVSSLLAAGSNLLISWTLKGTSDLIAGDRTYSLGKLLLAAGVGLVMLLIGWVLDHFFLSAFRAKAMKQYREYAFDRLMEKGIQAFSGENTSLYISALSNDVNTIEQDYVRKLQRVVEVAVTFVGALIMMIWYSPLLTLIAIGFSCSAVSRGTRLSVVRFSHSPARFIPIPTSRVRFTF